MSDSNSSAAAAAAAQLGGVAKANKPKAVRGAPKSSRPWKTTQTKQFSAMSRPKASGSAGKGIAFREQQARKATAQRARAELQRLKETRGQELKERREKQLEKQRRKAENELKGASYQTITDPTKLKKMTKKQLRQIKRTRVNADGVTELVPAYAK